MFSVTSVCDEEDRVAHYGEENQSISDLVSVQGHGIDQTDGQDTQQLGQSSATSVQGSYVSLLADTVTVDRTDEFNSRPLDTDLNDTMQYGVTNFSGKGSVQDIGSGTMPTTLQNDQLINYENQNLGYNLTSQPNNSQCLPQFVIFQNFGSSVISPGDGNTGFIHIPNTTDNQLIVESNKELQDAVANISDSDSLINQAADILPPDQSYLVSTNNQGEIQNIQIVPGSTLNAPNDSVKVQKKQKTSKVTKKRKHQPNSKPKEKSSELKKFSVDELTSEAKTKQQLYEEFIGMTELDKAKKKTENSKPVNTIDDSYTEVTEADDSNENIADVIHVRIEKPPEQHEQNNEFNNTNSDTMPSNKTIDDTKPVNSIDERQVPIVDIKALDEAVSVNKNSVQSTTSVIDEVLNGSTNDANENLVSEITIKVEDNAEVNRVNERSSDVRVQEMSRDEKLLVKSDKRQQLKRKPLRSAKMGKSSKLRKKDSDVCNADLEGRMLEDFCRIFKNEDKCVLKLKPITLKLMKPSKQLIVEVHVEDDICISSISQSSSSNGFVKHCMHFEEISKTDKVERKGSSNDTVIDTQISKDKKKKMTNKKKQRSSTYTSLNKRNVREQSVDIKVENESYNLTDVNVPLSDRGNFKLVGVTLNAAKDTISEMNNTDMVEADTDLTEDCDESALLESSTSGFDDLNSMDSKCESLPCDMVSGDIRTVKNDETNDLKKDKRKQTAKHKNQSKPFSEMSEPSKEYIIRINDEGHRMFSCPLCGYSSRYPQNARKHIYEHTAARDWTCEICGLGFKSNNHLQKHRVIHQSDRPFSCRLCPKMFKSKGVLKQHLQRHLGLKHYVCEFCSKGFVTTGDLNKHRRCHTGDTPYHCDTCDKQYADISALHRHKKDKHSGVKLFMCAMCSKQFPSQQTLFSHMTKSNCDVTGFLDSDRVLGSDLKPVNTLLDTGQHDDIILKTEGSVTIL